GGRHRFTAQNKPDVDGDLCPRDFLWGVPFVPSTAAHCKIHFALVRRRSRRVDDVPAFLSGVAPGRIRVCAPERPLADATRPSPGAFESARGRIALSAYHSPCELETGCFRSAYRAHSESSHGECRFTIFRPRRDRAAASGLAQPRSTRSASVPALCSVKR